MAQAPIMVSVHAEIVNLVQTVRQVFLCEDSWPVRLEQDCIATGHRAFGGFQV